MSSSRSPGRFRTLHRARRARRPPARRGEPRRASARARARRAAEAPPPRSRARARRHRRRPVGALRRRLCGIRHGDQVEREEESMSAAENLFGEEHVRRYRETNGEIGHIWRRGAKTLLLTTTGRTTGKPTTTPLIYENAGDDYVVVASKGGAPENPG